jgi:hypothetical protein
MVVAGMVPVGAERLGRKRSFERSRESLFSAVAPRGEPALT